MSIFEKNKLTLPPELKWEAEVKEEDDDSEEEDDVGVPVVFVVDRHYVSNNIYFLNVLT